jgi:hypothetical protein
MAVNKLISFKTGSQSLSGARMVNPQFAHFCLQYEKIFAFYNSSSGTRLSRSMEIQLGFRGAPQPSTSALTLTVYFQAYCWRCGGFPNALPILCSVAGDFRHRRRKGIAPSQSSPGAPK